MGKALLLAVLGAVILTTGLLSNGFTSALTTGDTKARDAQSMIAEEVARSGLSMTSSRLQREFDTWRTGLPVTPFGGGAFVTAIDGPQTGPFEVYSAGVVDGVDAQVTLSLARLADAPGALTVHSDSIDVTLASGAPLSGVDHTVEAGEGYGQSGPAHGTWAGTAKTEAAFLNALGLMGKDQIRGVVPQSDVHRASLPGEHVAMIADALAAPTHSFASDQTFPNQTFGSLDAPAVVVVDGDAKFAGGGGVGILYVKGSFRATGAFSWRGVVIAEDSGDMGFSLNGKSRIYGAAYALHSAGVSGAPGSEDAFVALQDVPAYAGPGAHTDTVFWPDIGSVTVASSLAAPVGATLSAPGTIEGSSLQTFLGRANIDGVDLNAGGVTNVNYTGPTQMPMLDVRPTQSGLGSDADVTLTFGAPLPPAPVYLYVADLDWATLTVTAYDASGAALPAVSWTKSRSVDLIAPDDGARTSLQTGLSNARLVPNTPTGGDAETIIDEIVIPDPSAIASLRFAWTSAPNQSDYVGLSVSTESIFEPKGKLTVTLGNNTGIHYASVEIGRLAAVLPSVRARARVVAYDYRTEMQMDRMVVRGPEAGRTYAYCQAGSTRTATSLMDLLVEQLAGATAGACP